MEISRKGAGIRVAGNFNWKLFTSWGTRFDRALRVELEPKAGFGDAFEFWMIILSFQYPFDFERNLWNFRSNVNVLFAVYIPSVHDYSKNVISDFRNANRDATRY